MTDFKARGIVLKTSDYKDNDKIIRLYTLEQGKINAVMRGVKKAKAKLKIPAQVFCFGEYLLSGRGEYPVVTGCTVEESFFSLCRDPDKFAAAAAVMELTEKAVPQSESNPQIFLQILKTMKELLKAGGEGEDGAAGADCRVILLNFMLKMFRLCGYNLKLEKCCVCGEKFLRERRFDFGAGGVACKNCAGFGWAGMSPLCNGVMLAAGNCDTDRLGTLRLDAAGVEEALNLSRLIAENVFECRIMSLG